MNPSKNQGSKLRLTGRQCDQKLSTDNSHPLPHENYSEMATGGVIYQFVCTKQKCLTLISPCLAKYIIPINKHLNNSKRTSIVLRLIAMFTRCHVASLKEVGT